MTENHEEEPQAEPEPQLTRKERRAQGKTPQAQQFGVSPTKGKGATVSGRRSYSNRRSG